MRRGVCGLLTAALLTAGTIVVASPANAQNGAILNVSDATPFKAKPGQSCTFTITRSGDTSSFVTVEYNTVSGTAKEDKHFVAMAGTLIFDAGQTTKVIDVIVCKQRFKNSSFTFELFGASDNATIDDASGFCVIKRKKRR